MSAVTSSVVRPGTDGDIESTWHCVDVVARARAFYERIGYHLKATSHLVSRVVPRKDDPCP